MKNPKVGRERVIEWIWFKVLSVDRGNIHFRKIYYLVEHSFHQCNFGENHWKFNNHFDINGSKLNAKTLSEKGSFKPTSVQRFYKSAYIYHSSLAMELVSIIINQWPDVNPLMKKCQNQPIDHNDRTTWNQTQTTEVEDNRRSSVWWSKKNEKKLMQIFLPRLKKFC